MVLFNNFILDTTILQNNAVNIKNSLQEGTRLCAVVKANAYGLGVKAVCKALKGYVDYFACACLKEALYIRSFDIETKIIILGLIDIEDIKIASENNIAISLGDLEKLKEVSENIKFPLSIHIQINTGLNRFGFKCISEFKQAIKIIRSNPNLILDGVYSHFATKSNDKKFINKQYLNFMKYKNYINDSRIIYHISNSYAITYNQRFNLNMVRTGFLLYGYTDNNINNNPVLSISSQIIRVLIVKKGETIGYDKSFKANKKMRVGVVPVGYADGFSRNLSNNFYVLVRGKKCLIIGKICMDVFMVDITDCNAECGDEVVLLGKQKGQEITLKDYAIALNTSPYEVMCGFDYRRMNYIVKNK